MSANTPAKQMSHEMMTAPVFAPPAAMSPAREKMPPQMLAVITIMVSRNKSRPLGSMISSLTGRAALAGALLIDASFREGTARGPVRA